MRRSSDLGRNRLRQQAGNLNEKTRSLAQPVRCRVRLIEVLSKAEAQRNTDFDVPRSNDLQSSLTNLRSANLTVGRVRACATEYNSPLAGKTSRYARGKFLCGMWRTTRAKGLARAARRPAVRSLRAETWHVCFVSI